MSLNKFTEIQKGLDLNFEIGCKDLVASGSIFKEQKIIEDMTSTSPKGVLDGCTYVQNTGIQCNLDLPASVTYTNTNCNFQSKIEGSFLITTNENTIIRGIFGKNAPNFDTLNFAYTPSDNSISIQSIINDVSTVLYNGISESDQYRYFKFQYVDAELNDSEKSTLKLEMSITGESYIVIYDEELNDIPYFEDECSIVVNGSNGNDVILQNIYIETYESFVSKPSPLPSTTVQSLGQIYMKNNTVPTIIGVLDTFYPILGIPVINNVDNIDFVENQGELQYKGTVEKYFQISFSISAKISIGQEYSIKSAIAVFKNDIEIDGSTLSSNLISDDEHNISGTCFTKFKTNDAINIRIKALTDPSATGDDVICTDYLLSGISVGNV